MCLIGSNLNSVTYKQIDNCYQKVNHNVNTDMRTTNDLKTFGWGLTHFPRIYSVVADFDGLLS